MLPFKIVEKRHNGQLSCGPPLTRAQGAPHPALDANPARHVTAGSGRVSPGGGGFPAGGWTSWFSLYSLVANIAMLLNTLILIFEPHPLAPAAPHVPGRPQIIQSEAQLIRAGVIEKSFGGIGECCHRPKTNPSPITVSAQCSFNSCVAQKPNILYELSVAAPRLHGTPAPHLPLPPGQPRPATGSGPD